MDEKAERKEKLARDILILSRNTLLVNLRFLDAALNQFKYIPVKTNSLLTDGENIFFNPSHILKTYKKGKEIPVRNYLHIVMHCIFRHMYVDPTLNHDYWDLACDIAVENTIAELNISAVATPLKEKQTAYFKEIIDKTKYLTAEKIYDYLVKCNISPEKIAEMKNIFYADDHKLWYIHEDEVFDVLGISYNDIDNKNTSNLKRTSKENVIEISRHAIMADIWKDIAERIQVDMETFGKQQGYEVGGLTQNLKEVNREKYDYASFLKKFAVMGETMKINDDEFDYIFYTYGMQLYKKMPLIEPLEYKEEKRIKEFVIAVDTSGSTSGELVQKFVQKTYNILKSTESFFSKINVHIIQCDADIQEDVKITNQEEFDSYLKTMKIHGLGGTDFRPVFKYVDELIKAKEFTTLKGLIYFTDGIGSFPKSKPPYDTAFVYIDDNWNNPDVPPWAIKLTLQSNEI